MQTKHSVENILFNQAGFKTKKVIDTNKKCANKITLFAHSHLVYIVVYSFYFKILLLITIR